MSANIVEEQAAHAALEGHIAPHADDDEEGDVVPMEESDPGCNPTGSNESNGIQSYAQAAANTRTLELHLYREDKGLDFSADYQEIDNLLHKRLLLPVGALISLDTTPMKKIIIEIDAAVDVSQLNITQALEVKKGLKTRPLQSPDTDREIRITRAPMKMDNVEIGKVLELFGEVTSPVAHVVMQDPPAGSQQDCWRFRMKGVKLADRTMRMKIKVNVPSFIVVLGQKLKINYVGQPQTCPRCQKYWGSCPGGGRVDKCKKANGDEKDVKTSFKQLVQRIKKKEKGDFESSSPLVPAMIPDPDQISFSGLPEDMTMDGFQAWLDASSITFLASMCFKGGKPGTFLISSYEDEKDGLVKLNSGEAQEIVTKLHGTEVNKRRVQVQMEALSTPSKKRIEVVTLDETDPEAVRTLVDPANPPQGGVVRDLKAERAAKKKERRKKAQEAKKAAKEEAKKAEAEAAIQKGEKEKKKDEAIAEPEASPKPNTDDDADLTVSESEFLSPENRLKVVLKARNTKGGTKTTEVVDSGKGAKRLPESSPGSPNTDAEGSPVLNASNTSPWNKGKVTKERKKQKHVL